MQDFHKPCIPFSLPLFPQKTKKKRFTINLSFNFSKNLLQRYYIFLVTPNFFSVFFSKKGKLIKYPPIFVFFCNIRSKNKAKRLNFMTILLFFLLERFAVYDNEEGCARQQLKICSVYVLLFCQYR